MGAEHSLVEAEPCKTLDSYFPPHCVRIHFLATEDSVYLSSSTQQDNCSPAIPCYFRRDWNTQWVSVPDISWIFSLFYGIKTMTLSHRVLFPKSFTVNTFILPAKIYPEELGNGKTKKGSYLYDIWRTIYLSSNNDVLLFYDKINIYYIRSMGNWICINLSWQTEKDTFCFLTGSGFKT